MLFRSMTLNASSRGTKYANPLLVQNLNSDNVVSSILKFSRYSDDRMNEILKNRSDDMDGLRIMLELLLVRISSLEEWKSRESGEMDMGFSNDDDSVFYGRTATAIANVSMNSVRLMNVEGEVSHMKQVIELTNLQLASLEEQLHIQAYNISVLAQAEILMLIDIKNVRNRLQNVEAFLAGGMFDKLGNDAIDETINFGKATYQILKSSVEWIPLVGNVIQAGSDLMEGVLGLITTTVKVFTKSDALMRIRGITDNAKILAIMVEDAGRFKPAIVNTELLSTNVMLMAMESFNTVKAISMGEVVYPLPTLCYYLRPLTVTGGSLIGKPLLTLIDKFGFEKATRWTNRIPVHAYIAINYPISSSIRRQFVVSVTTTGRNDDVSRIELESLLGTNLHNLVQYVDRIQVKGGDIWQTVQTLFATPETDIEYFEADVSASTLVETYTIKYNYNFMRSFFNCMVANESRYDLLAHNCQTTSREVINFCVTGCLPHWWRPDCSASCVEAVISDKFKLQQGDIGYPMVDILVHPVNVLTETGLNPNMLDFYRTQFINLLPSWLDAIS